MPDFKKSKDSIIQDSFKQDSIFARDSKEIESKNIDFQKTESNHPTDSKTTLNTPITYKECGVDIDSGNDFVEALKPLVKGTFSHLVLGGLGGFSGCFRMPSGYKEPILCAATDGVGSKLKLAIEYDRLDSIGIDLVAMCVNDLVCDFAQPLFFLDYFAMHKLEKAPALRILSGIVAGCKMAKCSLIGGESAEMPSIYRSGEFDLAGFAVGIAERSDIARRESVERGDIIIAFPSSGFHSNGFSLIRGILDSNKLDSGVLDSSDLIGAILAPTRIYVDEFLRFKHIFKALAHITGGGLVENLARVLPPRVRANIDFDSIKTPRVIEHFLPFVKRDEAWRVFNMGVGLVAIIAKSDLDSVLQHSDAYVAGEVG